MKGLGEVDVTTEDIPGGTRITFSKNFVMMLKPLKFFIITYDLGQKVVTSVSVRGAKAKFTREFGHKYKIKTCTER